MRERFITINFRSEARAVIEQANAIIADYEANGFTLTLRQLYYQFVAKGLIDNQLEEYKRLGNIVANARRAGLIDWTAIEDRTRFLRSLPTWESPADRIAEAADFYQEDVWASQPTYVEVWIEKDALVGVIEGVCNEFRVPYFSCRGNVSDSEMYAAGKRFAERIVHDDEHSDAPRQEVCVLHLGDHDPSGLDMTRDIKDRLKLFARDFVGDISVRRLALNINQTAGLPPNPAKEEDSRYQEYMKKFGTDCWELDALDPAIIANLIHGAVTKLIDQPAWEAALADEDNSKETLGKVAQNWATVEKLLDNSGE